MKILNGINDGMVAQRGTATNECDILMSLECDGEPAAKYDGKAVSLTREGDNWRLTGIPVGGPYTLTISDKNGEVDFDNIYVGDVWILAGQSNMEGAGLMADAEYAYESNPDSIISF